MNLLISAVVGALAAGAVLVGGVHVAQPGTTPVSKADLTTYSSH